MNATTTKTRYEVKLAALTSTDREWFAKLFGGESHTIETTAASVEAARANMLQSVTRRLGRKAGLYPDGIPSPDGGLTQYGRLSYATLDKSHTQLISNRVKIVVREIA